MATTGTKNMSEAEEIDDESERITQSEERKAHVFEICFDQSDQKPVNLQDAFLKYRRKRQVSESID